MAQTAVGGIKLNGRVKYCLEKQYFGTYSNGKFNKSQEPRIINKTYFDASGNTILTVSQQSSKLDSVIFKYNTQGKIISEHQFVNGLLQVSYDYDYDLAQRSVKQTVYKNTYKFVVLTKYDSLDNEIYYEASYPPANKTTIRESRYDGKLLQVTSNFYAGALQNKEVFTYNNAGLVIEKKSFNGDSTIRYSTTYVYAPDQKTLLKTFMEDKGGKHIRFSNEIKDGGKTKIQKEYYSDNSIYSSSTEKFDKFNNLIESELIRPKENYSNRYLYKRKYNASNQEIENEEVFEQTLPQKELTIKTFKYAYDSHGNKIKQMIIQGNNFQTTEYEIGYY